MTLSLSKFIIFSLFLCANAIFAMDEERLSKIWGQKYSEFEKLGKGSFGTVWLAKNINDPYIQVAIKEYIITDNKKADIERFRLMWDKEAEILKVLSQQPYIPRMPKFIEMSDGFLVMEFVPGKSAADPFMLSSERETIVFLIKCLETLHEIHKKGIVHRDLKPENIVIHQKTREPWIIDFGIAKPIKHCEMGKNTNIGTLIFKAPEIQRGEVGPYSDIYSLGATILILTGPLSDEIEWSQVVKLRNFSEPLSSVLYKMVESDSVNRYKKCSEILEDINMNIAPEPPMDIDHYIPMQPEPIDYDNAIGQPFKDPAETKDKQNSGSIAPGLIGMVQHSLSNLSGWTIYFARQAKVALTDALQDVSL